MHNWRLLLLAFLAVLQPITSFTERNLFDGREQCCDRNSLLRDSKFSYGTFRFNQPSENRRLNRAEIREDRRYEVRKEDTILNRPSADRRLVEFRSERDLKSRISIQPARFIRSEFQYARVIHSRRERVSTEYREKRVRDDHRISSRDISRDVQNQDSARVRFSRIVDSHQNRDNAKSYFNKASRDNRSTRNIRDEYTSRVPKDLRRETRKNRDNSGESSSVRKARQTRDVLQRARNDVSRNEISRIQENLRVSRKRIEERRARSDSRLQLDNNRERRQLDRRVRDRDDARESFRSAFEDRNRNMREEATLNLENIRDQSQRLPSRRDVERFDDRRLQRDDNRASRDRIMSARRDIRDSSLEELRNVRKSSDRSRTVENRNTRLQRVDTRRDSRIDETRFRVQARDEREVSEIRRMESRMVDRELSHRRNKVRRTMDRLESRDNKRNVRLSRSVDNREEREVSTNRVEHKISKNVERRSMESRLQPNANFFKTRETFNSIREKAQSDDQPFATNWQYIFYTLQALYICSTLIPMLTQNKSGKTRHLSWFATPHSLVKVD